QLRALETTERVASCFSVTGTVFIALTFTFSPSFRKPINRLIFYASWGNLLCNVATLMSQSGIRAGQNSGLCQFQGFLIQIGLKTGFNSISCLGERSLTPRTTQNLAMAINVYMTLFRKYNAQQLKTLEWTYQIMCYGLPFVVALVYLFIDTPARGKVYGDASLWCWISIKWVVLRIALVYAPAWAAIFTSFTLYAISGLEIFRKRQQLRAFHNAPHYPVEIENPFTNFKTTEIEITHELARMPFHTPPEAINTFMHADDVRNPRSPTSKGYDPYSINISSKPMSASVATPSHGAPPTPGSAATMTYRNNRAAMEANRAAWGYTKVALLFFVSLLITWVIYITTSWGACKDLFFKFFFSARETHIAPLSSVAKIRVRRGRSQDNSGNVFKKSRVESSLSDSTRGLAWKDGSNAV
ncbi:MAG: hypothetical protein Q9184_006970, partial [Pyrenodesmia sp. 2 TL-2023]